MLKYVGAGAFWMGVPARDLSEAEALEYDRAALLASGLYISTDIEAAIGGPDATPIDPTASEKGVTHGR